jgi:histidinol dehydrogenase
MRLQRIAIAELEGLGGAAGVAAHVRSLVPDASSVETAVREIVARVRVEGDAAVLDYTRRFDATDSDRSEIGQRPLLVAPEQLDEAIKRLSLDVVAGLQVTIANVALVADAGVREDTAVDLPQGQRIVLRELPVTAAAIYVPGGRAPYPSTVAMGVVTARAAGVLDVAVCAPPGADGEIDAAILGACRLCGVERVYRMGGAQAIAALAYGTDAVARVDVVVGPGNLYVQEAKRQLSATVGIDGFAGPSDLLVVLGAEVGEREIRFAALDMLAQAEHGEGSLVVAVSPGPGVNDALSAALEAHDAERPAEGGTFALVDAFDARGALELANAFAPEHLQLIGADAEALAPRVQSAGCVFVGAASATAFGDYVAGSNHILPTGGAARFASMLSPRHFRRRMAEVRIDPAGAGKLASAGAPIARAEGFEWHARSMEARMGDN